MDDIAYEAMKEKIDNLSLQVKQLRRANSNLKYKNRELGRVIKKLKEDAAKERKPHFRNGKRGTMKNG